MTNRHSNFKDRTNKKYGKLTVVKFLYTKQTGKSGKNAFWECRCDCGNLCIVSGFNLGSGSTKSCGCAYKDMGKRMVKPDNAHSKNALYNLYVQRCKSRKLELMDKLTLLSIVIEPCYYCGLDYSINKKFKYSEFKCNGLDRIDNSIGYLKDNVLPCCQYCNAIRMDVLTVKETKKVIDFIKQIRQTNNSPWINNRDKDLKLK